MLPFSPMGTPSRAANKWFTPSLYQQPHRLKSVSQAGGAAPATPAPDDKSGAQVWFRSWDSAVAGQFDDLSGNGRHCTFASGKEATLVSNYKNGLTAAKLLSTTLGIFSTANMIADGSPFGFLFLYQHAAAGGTFYHIPLAIRTATANRNFNLMISNDTNYYTTLGICKSPGVALPGFDSSVAFDSDVTAILLSYNGGDTAATASYSLRINNSAQALTTRGGSTSNNSNGNYINSFANSSPPQFPSTDGHIMEFVLYDSVITSTEADDIFAPYVEDTYDVAQA